MTIPTTDQFSVHLSIGDLSAMHVLNDRFELSLGTPVMNGWCQLWNTVACNASYHWCMRINPLSNSNSKNMQKTWKKVQNGAWNRVFYAIGQGPNHHVVSASCWILEVFMLDKRIVSGRDRQCWYSRGFAIRLTGTLLVTIHQSSSSETHYMRVCVHVCG